MEDKKWFYKRDGIEEEVPKEKWCWGVLYKDKKEFRQYGKDGVYHQFQEIDQKEVYTFSIINETVNRRFDIVVTEGMQLFMFYRVCGTIGLTDTKKQNRIPVFGYKKNGITTYHYILPNNTLLTSDKEISLVKFGAFN